MRNVVERFCARAAIVALSLALTGETAVDVNATSVNWDRPSFSVLKIDLLLCRIRSSWDRDCKIYRSDAQYAFDAVWSCVNEDLRAARCSDVKREFATQGSVLLDAVEVAVLQGHRSIPIAASNPWLANSVQQWLALGFSSDARIALLLIAAIAAVTITVSSNYARWKAHEDRVEQATKQLLKLRKTLAGLPSDIKEEQATINWFIAFFSLIDSRLSLLPNSQIPLGLADLEMPQLESTTTAAFDAVLGAGTFRGKGHSRRASKAEKQRVAVWRDRTTRGDDHKLVDGVMIIDLTVLPITMRIKSKNRWLGNPGKKSRYQWKVEATFMDVDEILVRSCPNQYETKFLTWCTEFDFEEWEGSDEHEARVRSMSWLARGLQRDAAISEGTAATEPYETSIRTITWLKRWLNTYPERIRDAEFELEQLELHRPLKWCCRFLK